MRIEIGLTLQEMIALADDQYTDSAIAWQDARTAQAEQAADDAHFLVRALQARLAAGAGQDGGLFRPPGDPLDLPRSPRLSDLIAEADSLIQHYSRLAFEHRDDEGSSYNESATFARRYRQLLDGLGAAHGARERARRDAERAQQRRVTDRFASPRMSPSR